MCACDKAVKRILTLTTEKGYCIIIGRNIVSAEIGGNEHEYSRCTCRRLGQPNGYG